MIEREEPRKWIERYRHRYRYTPGCKSDALPGVYKETKKSYIVQKENARRDIMCPENIEKIYVPKR
jgi:hypothetical protein